MATMEEPMKKLSIRFLCWLILCDIVYVGLTQFGVLDPSVILTLLILIAVQSTYIILSGFHNRLSALTRDMELSSATVAVTCWIFLSNLVALLFLFAVAMALSSFLYVLLITAVLSLVVTSVQMLPLLMYVRRVS